MAGNGGHKEYMRNFGGETARRTLSWKTEKDMGG